MLELPELLLLHLYILIVFSPCFQPGILLGKLCASAHLVDERKYHCRSEKSEERDE